MKEYDQAIVVHSACGEHCLLQIQTVDSFVLLKKDIGLFFKLSLLEVLEASSFQVKSSNKYLLGKKKK